MLSCDHTHTHNAVASPQILECVTINLTLVYALLAYSTIKKLDKSRVVVDKQTSGLDQDDNNPSGNNYCSVWRVWKSTLVYSIAWYGAVRQTLLSLHAVLTLSIFQAAAYCVGDGTVYFYCNYWRLPTLGSCHQLHMLVSSQYI